MSLESLFSVLDKLSGGGGLEKVIGQLEALDGPAQKAERAIAKVNDAFKAVQNGTSESSAKIRNVLEKTGDIIEGVYGKKASKTFRHFTEGNATVIDWTKLGKAGLEKLEPVARRLGGGAFEMLRQKMFGGTKATEEGMSKAAKATDALKASGTEGTSKLAAGASVAASAALALTAKLLSLASAGGDLVAQGAQYALSMAQFKEDTAFAWKYALGSAEQAGTTLSYAQSIANKLGTSVKGIAGQLSQLFQKGMGSRESEMVVQMVADIKAMGGQAEVGPLADAILAMKKQGAFTPEMLAPLTSIGPAASEKVFATLAKTLNITAKTAEGQKKEVLARMGELKGQKGLDALSKAFLATTGEKEAGAVAKQFQDTTITGSIDKVKAKVEGLFAALNSSGTGQVLVSILQKVATVLDPASDSGKKLVATLDKAAAVAGRLMGKINLDQLIGGFDRLVGAVDAVMGPLEAFGSGFIQGFGEAFGTVMEVIDMMGQGQSSGTGFADALRAVGTALGYIVVGVGAGIGAMVMLEAKLAGIAAFVAGAAGSIGLAIIDGIAGGLDSAKAKLIDRLQALAHLLPDTVRQLLGIHSPSKVFAEIGSFTMQGFAQGVDSEADNVREATVSTLNPDLGKLAQGLGASAGGGRSMSLTFNIDASGAKDPDAVRQAAEDGATAGAMKVLELLGLESGPGPAPSTP
jgi:hypothetical protein